MCSLSVLQCPYAFVYPGSEDSAGDLPQQQWRSGPDLSRHWR